MSDEESLHSLPTQVPVLWRWQSAIGCVVACALLWAATLIWPDLAWVSLLAAAGAALAVSATAADLAWLVRRRHTTYRFALDERGLRLRQGILIVHRTIVPADQILYVDVRQGPIERTLGLSTLRVGTLGSSHEVGPLADSHALALAESHLHRMPHDAAS